MDLPGINAKEYCFYYQEKVPSSLLVLYDIERVLRAYSKKKMNIFLIPEQENRVI